MIRLSSRLSFIYKILGIIPSLIIFLITLSLFNFSIRDGSIAIAILVFLLFLSVALNLYFLFKIKMIFFSDEYILIKGLWSEEKHDLGIIKEINDFAPLPLFYISLNSKTKFGKRIFYIPNFTTGLKRTNIIYNILFSSSKTEMDTIDVLNSYRKKFNENVKE